jgi:hypothetical protein
MLARFPRRRLVLSFEGGHLPVHTPSLMVGVNEYDPGGLAVRRRHGLDRGRLWLLIARHRHPLGFAWFAFRTVFFGLNQLKKLATDCLRRQQILNSAARPERGHEATLGVEHQLTPLTGEGDIEAQEAGLRGRLQLQAEQELSGGAQRQEQPAHSRRACLGAFPNERPVRGDASACRK